MHYVLRASEIRPRPAYRGNSKSYRRASLVDDKVGSVHMGLGLCELDAAGRVDTHLHSFEESFYVLDGEPVLIVDGRACRLRPGTCGLIPVGVSHAWLGPARGRTRWIDMLAPQPRPKGADADTFFLGPPGSPEVVDLDIRDPNLLCDQRGRFRSCGAGAPRRVRTRQVRVLNPGAAYYPLGAACYLSGAACYLSGAAHYLPVTASVLGKAAE